MEITLKNYPYKQTERMCYICHKVLPLEDFIKDKYGTGGIGRKCKLCAAKNVYRKKKKNKDKEMEKLENNKVKEKE